MTALISNHDGLITRRSIFIGALICAPAIVRATSLMPVRALMLIERPLPIGPQMQGSANV